MLLNKVKFDKGRCHFGIQFLFQYKKERNELASTEEITVFKSKPLHNAASHGADAFGHGAIAYRNEDIGGTIMGQRAMNKQPKRPKGRATGTSAMAG
jgi:hypothetical protein